MKRFQDSDLNATLTQADDGVVRGITFTTGSGLATDAKSHVRRLAGRLGIDIAELGELDLPATWLDPEDTGASFRRADIKTFFDTSTHFWAQTWLNTPVWAAGITATVRDSDDEILSLTNTSVRDVDAKLPPARAIARYRKLFAAGEKGPGVDQKMSKTASTAAAKELAESLDPVLKAYGKQTKDPKPELISGRFYVYQLDIARREVDHPDRPAARDDEPVEEEHLPRLPLPDLPKSLKDGSWHLVAELIVRLPHGESPMNWRLLVSVETGDILYARALTSHVNGLVYTYDPITSTGNAGNTAASSNAVLNPLRDDVVLEGLDPPAGGTQSLTGEFVTVVHVDPPNIAPPTMPAGTDFDFDARSDGFSAVNAYYQHDRFFRLVEDLGFPIDSYFDGTSFPMRVDHRGIGGNNNAHCAGDGDGIDHTCYGLIDDSDGNPMGNACEWSVVLHEVAGHGILNDHVNNGTLGFSHSAGDSFAIILNDFASAWHDGGAIDRFIRSPFRMNLRRSDRDPAAGWGWGGVQDDGSYGSEQILSTTMFRIYRGIGGDSDDFTRREFSANIMAYLMFRAVGTLTPATNPGLPDGFRDAMLTADAGDWTTRGISGDAYSKVIEWSFQQQGLDGGDPPPVDVYIDDGRGGEYEYLADPRATTTIWNRHAADNGTTHQDPVIGTNFAYVRIRNRGTSVADRVNVRGFHCKPDAGHVWPVDFKTMDTTEIAAPTIQPNNAEEIIVGPFAWEPNPNADGDDSMMMVVSAEGDPDNADKYHAARTIEDWRLVPNDNNIALRTVRLRPRLVTVLPDKGAFGNACVGTVKDMTLTLSNSGFNMLSVTGITSNSAEFIAPGVLSYPIVIASGDSIDVPLRFQPTSFGTKNAVITVTSNDPDGPRHLRVSGEAGAPRLVSLIANEGYFGKTCVGDITDRPLVLSNSGRCPLTVTGIASSSGEFIVPNVMNFPLVIGAGDSLQVPIRFQPDSFGSKSATLTITSDDPKGTKSVRVSGRAPSGRLTLTGSTCIGGVKACCVGEQTLTLTNTGPCPLHVTHVGLTRSSPHWKLVNNPFPATLPPGASLDLLIRYKAEEKCPRAQGLIIKTDDPERPETCLDLLAYTVWQTTPKGEDCGCGCGGCGDCCQGGCTPQSLDACCWDEECDDKGDCR